MAAGVGLELPVSPAQEIRIKPDMIVFLCILCCYIVCVCYGMDPPIQPRLETFGLNEQMKPCFWLC